MSVPFDEEALLDRVDNDLEFLAETIEMLDAEAPGLLEQARTAIERNDADSLTHAAHTLKGMIGNFCADQAFESARRLEFMGRDGSFDGADEGIAETAKLTDELRLALHALVDVRP